ncbi:PAS domain-containing protein [Natronolimnobius sp. AArcel1]|uniref:PAS domain-containing protein n=1 Tax=Natronolimnobius sp. AArcel1 TaxID=1679093 RepID=UPI0013ECDAA1|nr:PAS domain-containing protein [Natronolimnobius sp. AArcel1]
MKRRSIPALDRVSDAFFALDTDFRFTYLNRRAQSLLKRSRSELIGRVMWDEFPETVETQFPDGFHQAMDKQIPVSFEVYHTRLETWFEARAYPSETGLSVYMRDVTERKQQETALAQHAAVVEAISDGVLTLSQDRRIVSVNSALEHLLGTSRAELVGEHVEILTELADVADEQALEMGRAITDIDTGATETRTLEAAITNAAGVERMSEFRFVPIEDKTATVACVIRDITDQHEYERVATSLHEITRWLLDSDDPEEICAIAVHAGSDLLGLPISGAWLLEEEHGYLEPVAGTADAHDEFGGLPRFNPGEGLVWDVFEAGGVEQFDDLEAEDDLYNPETPIRSEIIAPIGTHGILMTGSFEANRFDETDVDLVSTLVENTRAALDRADREQILRDRTVELERQTERLESVADVLSNDLQQQLEEVADALDDDPTDDSWQFPLAEESVGTTLDRAERLIDDVREFARNASSVRTRSRIRLEQAVLEAADSSQLIAENVIVEQEATLRADSDRFISFLEAAFNDVAARSDTDKGRDVTVWIDVVGLENEDTRSRGFFLRDDAAESYAATHDRVFDPASPGNETARNGLGLALVKAIADAHDWRLSVDCGPDGGTQIDVRDVMTLELVDAENP